MGYQVPVLALGQRAAGPGLLVVVGRGGRGLAPQLLGEVVVAALLRALGRSEAEDVGEVQIPEDIKRVTKENRTECTI